MSPGPQERAEELNGRALALQDEGRLDEAAALFEEAIEQAPGWSVPWFNLGLMAKRRRDWPECARLNLAAAERDSEDKASWWNLGIAATALGDWPQARRAWAACGVSFPDEDEPGDGPPCWEYTQSPIRLQPALEVVWCRRLDPARARIVSLPLRDSGHRYGDLLLHDGEAVGGRALGNTTVPVFNMIELLERSVYETFVIVVRSVDDEAVDDLLERAEAAGMPGEDWSRNLRILCSQCSEGVPHEHEETAARRPEASEQRRFAIASRSAEALQALVDEWREGCGAEVVSLHGDGVEGPARSVEAGYEGLAAAGPARQGPWWKFW